MTYKEKFPVSELENMTEEIVFMVLDDIIESGEVDFNFSQISIQDIAAICLNSMPGRYYTCSFQLEEQLVKIYEQREKLIAQYKPLVLNAIDKVNQNPHD